MRAFRSLLILLLLTVVATAAAACGGGGEPGSGGADTPSSTQTATTAASPAETGANEETGAGEASGEPIIIGAAIGQTGWLSTYDVPAANFAELAVEDINASGGVLGRPLKIIYEDSKTDPAQGATAALEVLEQGADFVIAPADFDQGGPAARVANDKGVVVFAPFAETVKFGPEGIGPLAYTMGTGTPAQGAGIAEYAYNNLGFRTVYVLHDATSEYTDTLCQGFEDRWMSLASADSIVGRDTFQNADQSISSQATRLKGTSPAPDFIMLCSYVPGGASAVKQIRDNGIDIPIFSSTAMDGSFWLEAVPDLSNFYYLTYDSIFGDSPNQKVNEIVARYTEEIGEPPNAAYQLTGYSVIEALAAATEQAGTTDGAAVADVLNSFKDEPLTIGPTTFTPDLHINLERQLAVMEIEDGQNRFVEYITPEEVDNP